MRLASTPLMKRIKRHYRRISGRLPPPLQQRIVSARATLRGMRMLIRLLPTRLRRRADPDRLFVGWLLSGSGDWGPTRMRGLLPHAHLRKHGIHSVVLLRQLSFFELRPRDMARIVHAGFDVVVFESVSDERVEQLAGALRAAGTRTVYAVGELRRTRMPELVDRVILASDSLWDLTGGRSGNATIIESPLETPPGACKDYSKAHSIGPVRVVWVGYPENMYLLAPVLEALRSPLLAGFELTTISRGPWATVQWDRTGVWAQLLQCDIAVLPYDRSDWQWTKPNTRLTMLKALGLPIVATPIPSYTSTLTHGRGCFFARDVDEWVEGLRALSDPERRREVGLAERDEILARYGLDAIGGAWLELLEDLAGAAKRPAGTPAALG